MIHGMNESIRYKDTLKVTLVNSAVNTCLALFKIIIGYIGHSQALIADGIHSFSDLITDFLVLAATKLGGREPDKDHPYGHRRIETIATVIISLILIGVAASITYQNIHHILKHTQSMKPSFFVIVVAVISIFANEGLFRYTLHYGKQLHSELLKSNAWHNRSDVWVSVIVLIAVLGDISGIPYLDAIGALIIAILIFKMGITMIFNSVNELIDAGVDEKTKKQIATFITDISGVVALHQLRTRSHGGNIFADVHIQVQPKISVSEGHYISEQVHLQLLREFKNMVDVTVHIDPEDDELSRPNKNLPTRVDIEMQLTNAFKSLPGFKQKKAVHLHYLNGKIVVELVLPLSVLSSMDRALLQKCYQDASATLHFVQQTDLYFY